VAFLFFARKDEMMLKMRVGIVGATGYTGGELLRFLLNHDQVEITCVTSKTYGGLPLREAYPSLRDCLDLDCLSLEVEKIAPMADLFFLGLPHKMAMETAIPLVELGKKVIDLSADFRLQDPATYERWYGVPHASISHLKKAVYGLPELHKEQIRGATLIANPGCYPTGAILGLAPLLKERLIELDAIIIDSKSGTSGAGRRLDLAIHFAECNGGLRAYSVAVHRHTPEIEQELSLLAGQPLSVSFTPHLVPIIRGILSTIYVKPHRPLPDREALAIYRDFYREAPFVRVLPEGRLPDTKHVYGSNFCDIGMRFDPRTGRLIVLSAIDNLVKGASGQAIQCMNIQSGFDERKGLWQAGLFP
jgi:N-acetyl-gamma-glutamyl-phosphate reductase